MKIYGRIDNIIGDENMKYLLNREKLNNLDESHLPEWIMTYGNGGFSSGSVRNSSFRKHHGYLAIAKRPPTNRMLVLTKTEETIYIGQERFDLSSQKFVDHENSGHRYLDQFEFDGIPKFTYRVNDLVMTKMLAPDYGHNTIAIHYTIRSGSYSAKLVINPLINFRSLGEVSDSDNLHFHIKRQEKIVEISSKKAPDMVLTIHHSNAEIEIGSPKIESGYLYDFDISTGDNRQDSHYKAYDIVLNLKAHQTKTLDLIFTTESLPNRSANVMIDEYRIRQTKLLEQAALSDPFVQKLVLAADQFIVYRQSTDCHTILAGFPWFTDWGRDTMIAFGGLCLATKRYDEAFEILQSFAKYEKNGLIPNMFPDDGLDPLYNTVDASLWYFQAISQYLKATGNYTLVKADLYPCLKRIIQSYREGTEFSIGMDNDGLIHAGSGIDQVTWMDVRINGYVVTPRHGKPVEINALWFNALKIMSDLSKAFDEDGSEYEQLANQVHNAFNLKFWNEEANCLYDVIDETDASIRPNQLYALSLTYPIVTGNRAKWIIEKVETELLDVYGIRTLSIHDPRFAPIYEGPLEQRDRAYHMGTVWPFLLGAYLDGYLRVHNHSLDAKKYVKSICLRFEQHLKEGCINGISEIFDGLNGKISRGCFTQAWSVGEILRIYVENQLYEIE